MSVFWAVIIAAMELGQMFPYVPSIPKAQAAAASLFSVSYRVSIIVVSERVRTIVSERAIIIVSENPNPKMLLLPCTR